MNVDQMGQGALGVGILVAGMFNGWQALQAKRQAKEANVNANRAADNSHPVSNGWGTEITGQLRYLRESADRQAVRLDGMETRQTTADQRAQSAEIRTDRSLSEIRSLARTAAEQSSAVAAGLAAHLADHASTNARELSK